MNINKEYIGDSVYADYDGYDLILTTENGHEASNMIVLEPEVWRLLVDYVARTVAAARDELIEQARKA